MREPLQGKEFDEAVANRKAAKEMARDAAMSGCDICGGYFALVSSCPEAQFIDELDDYSDDDDDDIRPF